MKKVLTIFIILFSLTSLGQRSNVFFENYTCISHCLDCCDSVDVYVEISELNNKFFITLERISDDTTQYLCEFKIRKISEYDDGYYIKVKRNKERVKFFIIEYNVGCFMKHKHNLFRKCYIIFHNNEKNIQKQVIK